MQEALKADQLGQYAVSGDLDTAARGKVPESGLVSMPRAEAASEKGLQPAPLYKKHVKHKRSGSSQQKAGKKART